MTEALRILHIDDDLVILQLTRAYLERGGFKVTTEENSAKAARLNFREFDLVIVDLLMPEPDGLDLCARARDQEYRGPLLMLTSKDLDRDERRALDDLEVEIMIKPFGPRQLLDRVRQALAG